MEPTFTLTIPSIRDDLNLHCRIYSPGSKTLHDPRWKVRGAVIAHPYAPLGGSHDDWIVLSLVAELSRKGFVVGTFNFRYADDPIFPTRQWMTL